MKKQTDISIIIVNFNTNDLLNTCLASIRSTSDNSIKVEIIVVDNGSTDGSVAMVKRKYGDVIIIDNKKNDGFAKANNKGLRIATGKYLLLLNSDTELTPATLQTMIRFMDDHPKAGASTCKLVLTDGSMDPACHRGFPTPWVSLTYLLKLERLFPKTRLFGEYHQGYKNLNLVHEVDCISGAFFLTRREIMTDVGLLDEDYFMYAEDIDWAYRIRSKGWKILFNPDVTVIHKKKQSGRRHADRNRRIRTELYFHRYNWLFYKKNYEKKYGKLLSFLINSLYSIRIFLLEHFAL